MTTAPLSLAILLALMAAHSAMSQGAGAPQTPTPPAQATAPAPRPTPPTRDPSTPGYVTAKELSDGVLPPSDADGNFIREFGKAGDGPGYFTRPKGIAIDSDGHVWVADAMQDRVQVFTPEGRLLIWMGNHGLLPGQFSMVSGVTIDKQNRVITSEQYPGRVQIFRYVTDDEAETERARREELANKRTGEQASKTAEATPPTTPPK